jgi:hypothetical protein
MFHTVLLSPSTRLILFVYFKKAAKPFHFSHVTVNSGVRGCDTAITFPCLGLEFKPVVTKVFLELHYRPHEIDGFRITFYRIWFLCYLDA